MEGLRNKFIPWFLAAVVSLLFSVGPGLAYAHPPYWAPYYGYPVKHHKQHRAYYKSYNYIYYPLSQVYYSPFQRGYYYLNNGYWTFGSYLPPYIRLGRAVNINLGGPVPYYYHPTVVSQYPVPLLYY